MARRGKLKSVVEVEFARQSVGSWGRGETLAEAIKNALAAHKAHAGSMRSFGPHVPDAVSVYEGKSPSVTVEQIYDDLDKNKLRHCRQIIL